MSGDIKLSVGSDLVRSLGCSDLSAGKKFTLLLETDTNMLTYTIPNSGLPVPIKIKTDVGFAVLYSSLVRMKYYAGNPSIWISIQSRMLRSSTYKAISTHILNNLVKFKTDVYQLSST